MSNPAAPCLVCVSMNQFKISKSKHIVEKLICIVKTDKDYRVGFIHKKDCDNEKEVYHIDLNGSFTLVYPFEIYHIYHNDFLLKPERIVYEKIIQLKAILKGKDHVEISKFKYDNLELLRSFNHIEEKGGYAVITKPVKINKRQIGYLMQGAINAGQGDHEKAYNKFIDGLKQFNLTIVNT